ncbi:MAG: exonuclease SbcCD subunit D [Selenomonadaceae bacterium]|nr:exonuclease SbcCD subunit D [Selenomonadaceae bacterium]
MRLLHTSDWHLGKSLRGQPLLEDQKFIIDEIFHVIDDEKPDAIIIAGDIYDRAVPPAEAVDVFDETLARLAEKNLPTLIIAGNHDSATRLNFGSRIFADKKIFIASKVAMEPATVVLQDDFGEIYFSLIPFFDTADIREKFSVEKADGFNFSDANKIYIEAARQKIPAGKRSVAVAHAFISGAEKTDSVREIVGCAEGIGAEIFSDYNYVALGHIHSSHGAGKNLRYSGSPLKYSFDEANHKKGVTIVEIDGAGDVTTKKIKLTPRHDVRIVKGNVYELQKLPRTEDYICAQLTERTVNAADKLGNVFPNLLKVEFILNENFSDDAENKISRQKGGSTLDYFADFFKEQTGETLSDEYGAAMKNLFAKLARDEREA